MHRTIHLFVFFCVVAIALPCAVRAEDKTIGKLFTDPADRERMELYRRGEQEKEILEKPSVSNVRVEGIMMRSDGENVIWVNGEDTLESDRFNGIQARPESINRDSMEVPIQVDGRSLRIKPGQRWSESTDEVRDDY